MAIEKTEIYKSSIESIEVENDGTRTGIATSINPKTFGEMSIKIQESGQKHKDTEYRDI
ncbi:hypothetical protein J4474_02575 [Candidatus Pacearchaeota archaeon]|nr:hypothetical protein [Candidatus Pacearchaeota archaeon]